MCIRDRLGVFGFFVALEGQYLPLTQSFRIPAKVHGIAMGIINRIKNRIDKTWQPKVNQGSLQRHYNTDTIDMSSGEWLVLARTKYLLKDIEESLYQRGLYYLSKYRRGTEKDLHEAATAWEHLRQGQLVNFKQIESCLLYTSPSPRDRQKSRMPSSA